MTPQDKIRAAIEWHSCSSGYLDLMSKEDKEAYDTILTALRYLEAGVMELKLRENYPDWFKEKTACMPKTKSQTILDQFMEEK